MNGLTWEQLISGDIDVDSLLETVGSELPTAQRLDDIPEGLPTAFIDKHAFLSSYGRQSGFTYGVEESGAPISQWVAFASTWLTMARWEPTDYEATNGSLYVEFLSLAMVRYDNISAADFLDFIRSRSKGQWIYYTKKQTGYPYQLLRVPMRKVTSTLQDHNYARTFHHGADHHLQMPVAA